MRLFSSTATAIGDYRAMLLFRRDPSPDGTVMFFPDPSAADSSSPVGMYVLANSFTCTSLQSVIRKLKSAIDI